MNHIDIQSVDNTDNLHTVIREDLRHSGIKVPKAKKVSKKLNTSKSQDVPSEFRIFGNFLSHVPCEFVDSCGYVPKFLVDASKVIEENITLEGLFRKSGSVSRQKELKQQIEEGRNLDGANVFDVTSLIKQFFRELPEPLFTGVYHDSFIKCYHCMQDDHVKDRILLLCLLLPCEHLSTLRFTMHLLAKIADNSHTNKMDPNNLAVVVAPNIMHQNKKSETMNASEEKLLQVQTAIVEILLLNFTLIGMVDNELYDRSLLLNEYFGTDDELDNSEDTLECSKDVSHAKKIKKKRKRSGSLQGIVSSIAHGISKLRKSTDGKTVNVSHGSYISNESTVSQSSIKVKAPELMPGATPVLMRKRKASSEMIAFSATKKKAILQNLPLQTTLGNTPFTPMSAVKKDDARKLAPLETPNIDFSDKNDVAFSATPHHQDSKSVRKRLNLFSPGNLRKSKRGPSVSNPALQCTKKPSKTKNILRRLSGSRADKLDMPQAAHSTHVGQRLAGPNGELESTDDEHNLDSTDTKQHTESPIAVILHNSVLSASNIDHSAISVSECRNSLNEAFIDPTDLDLDMTPPTSPSTSSAIYTTDTHFVRSPLTESVSDTAIIRMAHNQSTASEKLHNRSRSADGRSLKRGQPNTIATGLLQGEPKKVQKLRRSYGTDKPVISDPIPVVVPATDNCTDIRASETDTTLKTESSPSGSEKLKIYVTSPTNDPVHPCSKNGNMLSHSSNLVSSKSLDSSHNSRGVSTRDPQKALSDTQLGSQRKTLQHSNSTDSVISSMSATSMDSSHQQVLQRTDSIDSGKGSLGSLLDDQCSNDKHGIDVDDLNKTDISCHMSLSSSADLTDSTRDEGKDNISVMSDTSVLPGCGNFPSDNNELCNVKKSTPLSNRQTSSANVSIIRSQSMYEQTNMRNKAKPKLQISQETQKLLSRAGFLQIHKTGSVEVVQLSADASGLVQPIVSDSQCSEELTEEMLVDNESPDRKQHSAGAGVETENFKTPSVPNLIHADVQMPKHESIVELKSNHAGRVAECVRAFKRHSQSSGIPADVVERHASPYRFPNSVTRKRGVSPIRIPTIFAKDESAVSYRDRIEVRDKLQNRLTAKLPISTQLIKPSENATTDNSRSNMAGIGSNLKRKPSIYYVTDTPKYSYRSDRSATGGSSLSSTSDHSFSSDSDVEKHNIDSAFSKPQNRSAYESMDVSLTENNMNDSSQTEFNSAQGQNIGLNSSSVNSINELCTPLSKKVVCQDTRTPLKDCNDVFHLPGQEKLLLKTPGELTPRQVIQFTKPSRTSCKSPAKSIKRLQSPGSPCRGRSHRYSTSPHKVVQGALSSVPCRLQDHSDDV